MSMSDDCSKPFQAGVTAALKESASIALAGGCFSFVIGVLMVQHGFVFLQAWLMNSEVYAGALEMISIPLWSQNPLPSITLVSLAFMVCLRYVMMGMVTFDMLQGLKGWRVYLALFFVADENWALSVAKSRQYHNQQFLFGYFFTSGVVFYMTWVCCGTLGMFLAPFIHHPQRYGLDFAFLSVFLAMLVGMLRGKNDIFPLLIAGLVSAGVSYVTHDGWHIVVGALLGSVVGACRDVCRS
ncbi:MAG: hypothetical protein CMF55_01610 [Legionellales bacterium]|nr:hypothetical protein [Legionellales bacterium]HAG62234.1 hypothetical protein [Coxiellaceae bacterium]